MDSNAVEVAEDLEQFVKTIAETAGPMRKVYHKPGVFKFEIDFCSPTIKHGKVIVVSKENITVVMDGEVCYSNDYFAARRELALRHL